MEHNGVVLVPALTGRYNAERWAELGRDAPDVQAGDLQIIAQPLDALGFNVYTGSYVRAADNAHGFEVLPLPKGYPQMHMPWLNFMPESLYWGVRLVSEALGKKDLPIYISENGCASDDVLTKQGEVIDSDRIMYMRSYLRSARRAIAEGYPLMGYFHWSLMDNFEWSWGYLRRFGLTRVDYDTLKRTPKLSFHWYQQVIRENRVL
jgi:beta-glucosidase